MDWKEDLGKFLLSNHIYRWEYLSKQLIDIAEEWNKYISKFDGINITTDLLKEYSFPSVSKGVKLSYTIKTKYFENSVPFIMELNYFESESNSIGLSVKYSVDYDHGKYAFDSKLEYILDEIIYEDDGIFEPTYIQQILNNILKTQFTYKDKH